MRTAPLPDMAGSGEQEILQGETGVFASPRSVVIVSCHVNFSRGVQSPFSQLAEFGVAVGQLDPAHRCCGFGAQLIGLVASKINGAPCGSSRSRCHRSFSLRRKSVTMPANSL